VKITAQFALWSSLAFATLCLAVGFSGLSQIEAMADAAERSDARGYAYFWLFLGAIAVACAVVSRWIIKRENDNPSDG
jgi:hypothetical protein